MRTQVEFSTSQLNNLVDFYAQRIISVLAQRHPHVYATQAEK